MTSDIERLGMKGSWANIASIGLVESSREVWVRSPWSSDFS